ncbi:MAG: DUF4177 domain-containing protein [Agriterribacter sp.]
MKRKIIIVAFVAAISLTVMFVLAQTAGNRTPAPGNKKFVYAVFYFSDEWNILIKSQSMWVNSDYISSELNAKVKNCKYTDDALNALGAEGWELVSVINERTAQGTEYYHYLKKAVN